MRIVLAVGLLVLLLAPFVGMRVWHGWERWQLRQRIRAQILAELPDSALTCVRISVYDACKHLRWEREDEFVLNGQWYDVARHTQQGDTLILWCVPDDAETAFENRQKHLIAQALAASTPRHNSLQRLWLLFFGFFLGKNEATLSVVLIAADAHPAALDSQKRAQTHCIPLSPPPECGPAPGSC